MYVVPGQRLAILQHGRRGKVSAESERPQLLWEILIYLVQTDYSIQNLYPLQEENVNSDDNYTLEDDQT